MSPSQAVFQFRVRIELDSRLDLLRRERQFNVSAWVRDFPEENAMAAAATLSRSTVLLTLGSAIDSVVATLPEYFGRGQVAINPGDSSAWTAKVRQVPILGPQHIVMQGSRRSSMGASCA